MSIKKLVATAAVAVALLSGAAAPAFADPDNMGPDSGSSDSMGPDSGSSDSMGSDDGGMSSGDWEFGDNYWG